MGVLDSRLKFLRQQSVGELAGLESSSSRFSVTARAATAPRARVLLDFGGNLDAVRAAGFEPTSFSGRVAAGFVELPALERVAAVSGVRLLESSRPLARELDISRVDLAADIVQSAPASLSGAGVIVGIIDSGVDFTHGCFRHDDGSSRILALWDQFLMPTGNEHSPQGFGYGVEYSKNDLDAALASATPALIVRHHDASAVGHGTHVAGIAAGNGRAAGNGAPAGTFVGIAPGADLVVVANNSATNLGDSANTLDAVNYILAVAAREGRPVVINLSQGDNLGPHDGTSLLERGMDAVLTLPGRAVVKSAGNAGADDIHASGEVARGQSTAVLFLVPEGDVTPDTFDIWYAGIDRFDVTLFTPDGQRTVSVAPETSETISLPNGNIAFIDSTLQNPFNQDNRIYIQVQAGALPAIEPGLWAFALTGRRVLNGGFHAWIERDTVRPTFIGATVDRAFSLTTPGTSQRVISVANYVTRVTGIPGEQPGIVADSSSLGPTRDGRMKPEIAAPGQSIVSARAGATGVQQYRLLAGTSMAAPHVTGLIALLLERRPTLTADQIVAALTQTARQDVELGPFPNVFYGFGKAQADAALAAVDAL